MASLIRCLLGPRLYRQHRKGPTDQGTDYSPHGLERHSDSILGWASIMWSITLYTSPLLLLLAYKKGHLNYEKAISTSGYLTCVTIFLFGVFCARGIGRYQNPDYVDFVAVLDEVKRRKSAVKQLNNFDYEFRSRPVDYRWNEQKTWVEASRYGVPLLKEQPRQHTLVERLSALPLQLLGSIVVRTFGRRLVYPGSLSLLQNSIGSQLHEGRAKLVEQYRGQRAKLQACDGNYIDCMFVDRRGTGSAEGDILVICCEGNAGFYEVGCMATPLQGDYSVLGWNHPGFASSTGVPGPQTEANAMDIVVNFALHKLGFSIDRIFIYAWSIGGFTGPLVIRTVKEHMDLNNCEQLCKYPGPVLLIRRTRDEVISLVPEVPSTNRGNELLMQLMEYRYPNLIVEKSRQTLLRWLAVGKPSDEARLYSQVGVSADWCSSTIHGYIAQEGDAYPWTLGSDLTDEQKDQMVIFLAKHYMKNINASHCTPLPASDFALPQGPGKSFSGGTTGH
uniref:phosphatidylserine lipase ABHD16A isoform X2 n=1 Tax=Myxine glutinosa TaxID=7769 RepID=UPI00358EC696